MVSTGDMWPAHLLTPKPRRDVRDRLGHCLKTAIPLPASGSFNDLLAALDKVDKGGGSKGRSLGSSESQIKSRPADPLQ